MIHEFVRMCESVGMAQTVCVLRPAEDRERLLAIVAAPTWPRSAFGQGRRQGYGPDLLPTARPCHALDRPRHGQSRRREPAGRTAPVAGASTAAAPHSHLRCESQVRKSN
jgi:hypothetical protein